ncbi:hypothetical protein HWC07_gp040 [Pantoea phage vB_PagM_LIET2]|uniref:Uncharacterized protein n=1 Tax=Pantoea phage vB_PagM_LIET2 TaxID=2508071 RepID=A0A411AW10_9CAUD|nr:hypothetical protein HWC07_gp040 [Pantoea phage vB_PagM_LIET2]QAX92292.1 hypothetical protein LIET2_gp040 [Pantoea phage vB_PagM_LIET2]UJH95939.1 hypothetical protein [Pantoea phage Nafs113]
MNEFLIWLGWHSSTVFGPSHIAQSFWSSPLGLTCTALLCLTSVYRVIHRQSSAGLFDTIWHFFMSIVAFAAFCVGLESDMPHQIVKSMIILMAIRGVYKSVQVYKVGRRFQRT